jgi:ferric-dicitrate binding protein FerR (iron transport regulator)
MTMADRNIDTEPQADDAFERLFEHASPRRRPPEDVERRIREALAAEWAVMGRRRARRRAAGWAAAACVVATAAWILGGPAMPSRDAPRIATVARAEGSATVTDPGDGFAARAAAPAAALSAGEIVATGDGEIALRLLPGGSLRLDTDTRVRLISGTEIELIEGALYFDSQAAGASQHLTVRTEFATLRDLGTQFMARLDRAQLAVSVREGRVAVEHRNTETAAAAGEKLTVTQRDGDIRRETIPVHGEAWHWAENVAPPFDIDGRSLSDFLGWVARQTGHTLEFLDPATERVAHETILHGSVELAPMSKLAAVLATTDLTYRVSGDRLLIRPR